MGHLDGADTLPGQASEGNCSGKPSEVEVHAAGIIAASIVRPDRGLQHRSSKNPSACTLRFKLQKDLRNHDVKRNADTPKCKFKTTSNTELPFCCPVLRLSGSDKT